MAKTRTTDPLAGITTLRTPQTEKAKPNQVKNAAGGFVFKVGAEEALLRFLILGTTGGTYYQGEQELTKENAARVIEFAQNDGVRLVEILVDVSVNNRAPKQNPTIFALAVAASVSDEAGRKAAFDAMPAVLRTGTHFMMFHKYVQQFRGWGMGLRKAGQRWLDSKSVDQLAYQMVKYRSREGFTQRDLLRLIHPKTADATRNGLYKWVTSGEINEGVPMLVNAFTMAQGTSDVKTWVDLVHSYGLSWEMLPDAALKERAVWDALLDKGMPMTALLRQLPRLTNLGVVAGPLSKGSRSAEIAAQLTNPEYLQKARVHPYNVLVAQRTYAAGRSFRGSNTWTPDTMIVDALDSAFYASFGNVEPANKRTMIGLDVSGSMGSPVMDGPLTAREGSAAMSLITAATEPWTETYGFTGGSGGWGYGQARNRGKDYGSFYKLGISPKMRLDSVISKISNLPFGTTDVALPMTEALRQGLEVDTFLVITDNETYGGKSHVFQALEKYRNKTGINSRLIVVGMTATECSVIDPEDVGSLGVVGMDSAAPTLISNFSAGKF